MKRKGMHRNIIALELKVTWNVIFGTVLCFLNKMYGILYKNLYKKRREIMKNESLKIMLSVLAVGILLTGCRSKNEGNGTDNSSDQTTETDQN